MAKKQPSDDVSIGKFDILATYTYAQALLDGLDDDEAKQRGMVAAIMGVRHGWASGRNTTRSSRPRRKPPRRRKRRPSPPSRSTSRSLTRWASFFDDVFLPMIKKLVEAGMSYDEVKRLVKIPRPGGRRSRASSSRSRASAYLSK